jgi:prepilin-type processing-associated H-X9-DG protein
MYSASMTESTSVDSALAADRDSNHSKYGNVLFCDSHVSGFAGAQWSNGNIGSSGFTY